MGDLEEDKAVVLVHDKLAKGETALAILEELQAGMSIVGQRFEDCEYYLSELIYAADIFKKAGAPLQEELKSSVQRATAPWSSARSRTTSTTSAKTSWPRS